MVVNLDQQLVNIETNEALYDKDLSSVIQEVLDETEDNISIKDFFKLVAEKRGEPLTVGRCLRNVLMSNSNKEISVDEVLVRYETALEMKSGGEYTIREQIRDYIKQDIVKVYAIQVSGQIMQILNNDN